MLELLRLAYIPEIVNCYNCGTRATPFLNFSPKFNSFYRVPIGSEAQSYRFMDAKQHAGDQQSSTCGNMPVQRFSISNMAVRDDVYYYYVNNTVCATTNASGALLSCCPTGTGFSFPTANLTRLHGRRALRRFRQEIGCCRDGLFMVCKYFFMRNFNLSR